MARPRAIYRGKRKYGWIITVVLFLLIIAFMVGMWVFYDMQKYIRYEKNYNHCTCYTRRIVIVSSRDDSRRCFPLISDIQEV